MKITFKGNSSSFDNFSIVKRNKLVSASIIFTLILVYWQRSLKIVIRYQYTTLKCDQKTNVKGYKMTTRKLFKCDILELNNRISWLSTCTCMQKIQERIPVCRYSKKIYSFVKSMQQLVTTRSLRLKLKKLKHTVQVLLVLLVYRSCCVVHCVSKLAWRRDSLSFQNMSVVWHSLHIMNVVWPSFHETQLTATRLLSY